MKLIAALVFTLFMVLPAQGNTALVFSTADDQDIARSKSINAVLAECFKRMGISITIKTGPSKRTIFDANEGVVDGNFVRTKGISNEFTNLIRIPEPLGENIIVAFSRDSHIKIEGWESLLPYHVAWVRGWCDCNSSLSKAWRTNELNNEKLLFTFLKEGRADVGIFGLEAGQQILKRMHIDTVSPILPPIVKRELFLYLNTRHAALVPHVVDTLRTMKEEGTYQAILDRYYMQQ
ncbi:substrate-binding periplasmic protein [Pseudodesulfovibrio sediminis]|uniref:ABC transporter substrate-binding protein n=1 Tax=Pseudodesulfovibrio sediminis TaxID=2810563 RepID=A0ABM7P8L8_9BACT|nr:hypothetical protein [Pseudodesulfovibrio sediminis]BCS89382.1 ABC transporter substrate-binding protein [Pseudodesulfovibrio sediminis]